MRILILVQGCDDSPYDDLMKTQMETWDSIDNPNTLTVYFIADSKASFSYFKGSKLYLACSEAYNMMHYRQKLALDIICEDDKVGQWDYIFRTNASSYVNKTELLEFAKSLPKEKCYCGIDGGSYASGAGVFLSRDVVDIIRANTDDSPTAYEDAFMGAIIGRAGVKITQGAKRFDIDHNNYNNIPKAYHYRCKSDTTDRSKDITAFKKIFEKYPNN